MAIFTLRDLIAARRSPSAASPCPITNNGPTNINTAVHPDRHGRGFGSGHRHPPRPTRSPTPSVRPQVGIQFVATVSRPLPGRRDDAAWTATGSRRPRPAARPRPPLPRAAATMTISGSTSGSTTIRAPRHPEWRGRHHRRAGASLHVRVRHGPERRRHGRQTEIRFDLDGSGGGGGGGLPADFDGLQYIASYSDLIAAFGANAAAGEQHFLSNGQAEGRQADLFSETQYLRNYGDLQAAFGTDVNAATIALHHQRLRRGPGRRRAVAGADRRPAVHRLQRRSDRGVRRQCGGRPAALCQQRPGRGPGTRQFQRDPVPRQLRRPAGRLRHQRRPRNRSTSSPTASPKAATTS